jgi:hypothetical protein
MKRTITTAAVCAGLALVGAPAGFAGDGENNGKDEIAKACHELKKADKDAFRATYGPKHAMRHCKKGEEPVADETTPAEFKNAAKECRAEKDADADAFHETYGTNGNKKNAFGKCVSTKVNEDEEETPVP